MHPMIAVARERSPEIDFRIGNLLALDEPDNAYDGLVAFYAIVHLEGAELAQAFANSIAL